MITPPSSTTSFYTMLFTAKAGTEVLKLLVPEPGGDIENVLITSLDMKSDVLATVECEDAAKAMAERVDPTADRQIEFNPIYLPNRSDLFEQVEYDDEGDLTKVAGFGNPFVSASLKYSAPEQPEFIDAHVCYKQFDLPNINELLKNEAKVMLS